MTKNLYYIHDPMCSWCWGFRPVLKTILQHLPADVDLHYVVGGLAPDSDQPMPEDMQLFLQNTWQKIQQHIPGTKFNFDFWTQCQPRRSTYPSCRAVLAARVQGDKYEPLMIDAIQEAYYLQAQNPSDDDVLISLAESIGLGAVNFTDDLNSKDIHKLLEKELRLTQTLFLQSGISGFPSLILELGDRTIAVPRDYTRAEVATEFIRKQLETI